MIGHGGAFITLLVLGLPMFTLALQVYAYHDPASESDHQ